MMAIRTTMFYEPKFGRLRNTLMGLLIGLLNYFDSWIIFSDSWLLRVLCTLFFDHLWTLEDDYRNSFFWSFVMCLSKSFLEWSCENGWVTHLDIRPKYIMYQFNTCIPFPNSHHKPKFSFHPHLHSNNNIIFTVTTSSTPTSLTSSSNYFQ